ncbi:MAG TPA: zf-TFIIB domain-containing protein [Thermoanaerobaculia bacterium]|nr:zf-TFIIB domain-containing protein [Thermoanaerobaculia bacterium]
MMECPVCITPLIAVERQQIEVDYCLNCRGLWFDEGELELLADSTGHAIDLQAIGRPASASSEKPRRCPRCRKAMDKVDIGRGYSLYIDRCPAGEGLWLDRGELGGLVDRSPKTDAPREVVNFLGELFGSGPAAPPTPPINTGGER